MSSESDSKVVVEDDEEKKIYQLIYDMYTADDREREENLNAQAPSSSEHFPVRVQINAKRSLHAVVSTAKGSDRDQTSVDNSQEMLVQKVNVESIMEKPWRKADVDISDYFNYGFDEESWNTYCKKQTKLCAANAKFRVQKGYNRHGEEELCCAYASSGRSSRLASRESSSSTDVIGGRPGYSRRVEGHQCLCDEGNNTQVVTQMSSEESRITSNHPTPPSSFGSLFAFIAPPPFLYRREPPPLSPVPTLDSGHAKECDDPSTSEYPFSSGTVASSAAVTNTAKAWEYYILQKDCDKVGDRLRDHGHDKNSKRGRDRERGSSSSQNSGEERMRHRDTVGQGHRLCLEGDNGEKEERLREKRHKNEGWQKSLHSSSSRSRRNDGEDRKSQNRHNRKKTKRNGKDKETS